MRSSGLRFRSTIARAIIASLGENPVLKVYAATPPRAAWRGGTWRRRGTEQPFHGAVCEGMAARGVTTATFDFPYMAAAAACPTRRRCSKRRGARPSSRRADAVRELPLFIGGKSMGGRIASHIASQGCPGLPGVFFLGYPLHPPGAPEKRRDAHLPADSGADAVRAREPRRVRHVRRNRCAAALAPARHAPRGPGRRSFVQGPRPRRPQARSGARLTSWTSVGGTWSDVATGVARPRPRLRAPDPTCPSSSLKRRRMAASSSGNRRHRRKPACWSAFMATPRRRRSRSPSRGCPRR